MDAMQERLKISHRNFEQWKKRMKEGGYDVIGENAFKRTKDETSPSGFRRTRVSNYSKNVRDKPRGQNLPPSAKTSKTPTTQPRTWQSPHGQKSDKPSEGDFRKQFPQNKTKSTGDSGGNKTLTPKTGDRKTNKDLAITKSNVFTKHYKTGKALGVMTRNQRRAYDKAAAEHKKKQTDKKATETKKPTPKKDNKKSNYGLRPVNDKKDNKKNRK